MIYVILGQTASGKTSLALRLAREFQLPVFSADAYQCYKMMQIGTDKPTRQEVDGLKYHFYDEYDPDFRMNVSLFQKECLPLLEDYVRQGQDVLVVGGTFLYIKALLYGYRFYGEEEDTTYDGWSLEKMQEELSRLSPKTYSEIDIHNPRRVKRALEQIHAGHERDDILENTSKVPLFPTRFFILSCDKEEGNRKIDERVDRMFVEGFPKEVERLLSLYPKDLYSFRSLGYRELIDAYYGDRDLLKARELIKVHTHQYAKKQRTFLRHQFPEAIPLEKEELYQTIKEPLLLRKRTKILLNIAPIEKCRVLLAGLGGVGGAAFESLLRIGFSDIEIVDFDTVDPTNLNRQILYTREDIGKDKVDVALERAKKINPLAYVRGRKERIAPGFLSERKDVILDAIDDVKGKVLLFKKALAEKSLFLTSAGFGFHVDSTKIALGKLGKMQDPLSKAFLSALKEEGLEKEGEEIDVVYPKDARLKGRKNDRTIGSFCPVVNAGGFALISLLVKRLEETKDE